ncbi:MAG: 50S ribosomal protein L24 [Rickettsiales bacterium]|nr:50S ribosomal protein L24 [Rickettsiales bacterium]|tara:strand:- start:11609 stop:11932 length:324 start_codon:yes stop_codon:yes gene_type:complete
MAIKFNIKSGDTVFVTVGKDKGKTGEVQSIDRAKHRVIVKGINIQKKHQKPSQGSPGGLIEKEGSIHISNVNLLDPKTKKPTRVGVIVENGKKVRVAKKSKQKIDEK